MRAASTSSLIRLKIPSRGLTSLSSRHAERHGSHAYRHAERHALPWCDRNQIAKAGIASSFLLAMTHSVIANAALAE
ncbi:hypothetical protein LC653_36000 [Nostoc sp. CHAB 5784]|uniref:hypothetical protein n=1 Tax=Nostoc mirabile TaxID=2907820 RepID=UPI001E4FB34A|nr:hypothetical protein [Nostoc mirabile]MCC5669118.1 hypothetical protein [Nostoc mirabile CHAB5784]